MKTNPEEIAELEARIADALATSRTLQAENERLRGSCLQDSLSWRHRPQAALNALSAVGGVDARSPEAAKVALFRSLFRGRDDVYAYRWEGRDGWTSYSPALRHGARRQKGQRPDPHVLLPLDAEVVQSHLLGRRVIGIYPLLEDETCWFLASDFDKATWQADIAEVVRSCDELAVPASVERSRSGRGGHVWIFFERPVAAATARNLGCAVRASLAPRSCRTDQAH